MKSFWSCRKSIFKRFWLITEIKAQWNNISVTWNTSTLTTVAWTEDDFVYDYHSSIVRQEKQFAEFYVNTKKNNGKIQNPPTANMSSHPKKDEHRSWRNPNFANANATPEVSIRRRCVQENWNLNLDQNFQANLKNVEVLCQQRQACADLFFILESSIDIAWACWLPSFGIKCLSTSQICWKRLLYWGIPAACPFLTCARFALIQEVKHIQQQVNTCTTVQQSVG